VLEKAREGRLHEMGKGTRLVAAICILVATAFLFGLGEPYENACAAPHGPGCGIVALSKDLKGPAPHTAKAAYLVGNPGEGLLSYTLDWGDGSPPISASSVPGGTIFSKVAHTYTNPGTYKVTLTVTDAAGQKCVVDLTVQVLAPPPTPPPTPTPPTEKEVKVVPVKFCILSERPAVPDPDKKYDVDDAGDNDDGRFNEEKRTKALVAKSTIWSQAGIEFKLQGYVVIDDPDKAIGKPGDVRGDDSEAGRSERRKVRDACDTAIGEDTAREKVVDIFIRNFVDETGNVIGGTYGIANWVDCCKRESPPSKAMVRDPDTMSEKVFDEVLAHENGHVLCLYGDYTPPLGSRLMDQGSFSHTGLSGNNDDDGDGKVDEDPVNFDKDRNEIDDDKDGRANEDPPGSEISRARAEAKKYSGKIPKNKKGERLPGYKPRSTVSFDLSEDVSQLGIDIHESIAVKTASGDLGLEMEFGSLVPDNITGLTYVFITDTDNDASTGSSPDVGFPHAFQGAELVAQISVTRVGGATSVTVVARRFEAGQFVEVIDPRIVADLVTTFDIRRSEPGPSTKSPAFDSVAFLFPADLLPVSLAEGYRVASFAFDGNTGELDEAPIVSGSITEFPEPQWITINPVQGVSGDRITIAGEEFAPNSTVDIFFGTQLVASMPTDDTGFFVGQFAVPPFGDDTFIYSPYFGEYVSPVTAIDRSEEEVGKQKDKKSDAVILQRVPPGVGGMTDFTPASDEVSAGNVTRHAGIAWPGSVTMVAGSVVLLAAFAGCGWYARRRRAGRNGN